MYKKEKLVSSVILDVSLNDLTNNRNINFNVMCPFN